MGTSNRDDDCDAGADRSAGDGAVDALSRRLGRLAAVLPWSLEGAVLFRDGDRVVVARPSGGAGPAGPSVGPAPAGVDDEADVLIVAADADGLVVESRRPEAVDFDSLAWVPGGLDAVAHGE